MMVNRVDASALVRYIKGMATTTSTTTTYDANDSIRDILVEAGFMPLEMAFDDDEINLTAHDGKVLGYYMDRGWDAFRIVADDGGFELVRWSEDSAEAELLAINLNGVTEGSICFPLTRRGMTWLASVVGE